MEIFLLFVVILLMVIFETSRNAKISNLERKINSLESYLKKLLLQKAKKETQREAVARPEKQRTEPERTEPAQDTPSSQETSLPPVLQNFGLKPPGIVEETEEEEEEKEPAREELSETIPEKKEEEPLREEITETVPEKQEEPVREEISETMQNKEESPGKKEEPAAREKPAYAAANKRPQPVREPEEDWYTRFRRNNPDLEKFIGENILSKVAITILVLGIAFFVKYAIDKNWINEAARVGIGILCGGVILGFAHKLRARFKAFSSVLVAGGIAIFYFTIGIGFHQYALFSQTAAFTIMLLITAFSVFISVSYDRMELAVLSIIGGFATPFMVSTGQGNYQVLFTYILILDLGMLVLAYLRKWNLVNILTYCFTLILYIGWLESKVMGDPRAPYLGALLFGAAFYMVFVFMNIVNNVKEKRKFDVFELSILLSNTFVFYGEGMHILNYYNKDLQGLFSACMALFNLVCAWLLYKRFRADEKLIYLMIGLTLTFVTLIAPVQLDGNHITLFWALESVLLMWLAQRSGIVLYRFASVLIMALMLLSLFMDWVQVYHQYNTQGLTVLLNKGFITGLVSGLSLGATLLLLSKESREEPPVLLRFYGMEFHAKNYSSLLRIFFVGLLYFTGMFELVYQLSTRMDLKNTLLILVQCYHLLFVLALNYGLYRHQNHYLKKSLYYLNLVSVLVFVVGFSALPVSDLEENLIHVDHNYAGFLFHYLSLGAAVLLAMRVHRMMKNNEVEPSFDLSFAPALIAAVITYICSAELLLHVGLFTVGNVSSEDTSSVLQKFHELRITNMHVVKIGFPILWGILAFVFLSTGMRRHNKMLRISGLILIAVILLKLFTYDIQNASEAGKIVAFIILGIVLLIISFMYQKIKALIMDDGRQREKEEDQSAEQ